VDKDSDEVTRKRNVKIKDREIKGKSVKPFSPAAVESNTG
jgi:hypothetical protein